MLVIDVREPAEYAHSHAKGAVNIPLGTISNSDVLAKLGKNEQILVYCNSGNRSGMAKQILDGQGYTNVSNAINQKTLEANQPE